MQLLGTGKQRATKTSRILVGATGLTYASWENTLEGEDFRTTNMESYNVLRGNTFGEGILGNIDSAIRGGGDWDAGTNPYDAPPGLYPRDDLQNLSFLTSRLDVIGWLYPYARIRSSTNGGQMSGKVTFNFSGHNQGPFDWPVGSV